MTHARSFGPIALIALALGAHTLAYAGSPSCLEYVPGEVLVKLHGAKINKTGHAFIGRAVSEKSMRLIHSSSRLNVHHFSLPDGKKVEDAVAELNQDPSVEMAEPNCILHGQSLGVEGSPKRMADVRAEAANQASSGNSAMSGYTTYQTSAPVDLTGAWSASTDGLAPVVVGVVDTGIDYTHSVFTGSDAVWSNTVEVAHGVNGIDDDSNGYVDDFRGWNFVANSNDPMDDEGHGTHVSGIILGVSQDITAATLQPAKVKIMPVKFLDSSGSGSTSNAVLAIDYAIQNGARVLNNSWGGGSFSNSLLTAISSAYDKKVVFAAAAGNAGTDNDASPTYPASYTVPNIISVAATSDSDALASFSNYGANTVHLGSPGVSIYSTYPNDLFARESGTSMATPFIAGVAALVLREKPSMNAYQVKQLILTSANSATSLSGKTTTGARANFANPINAAKITAVSSSEPSFNLDAARQPASDGSSGSAGCGLVSSMTREGGEPPTPFGQLVEIMMSIVLLTAPLVVGLFLRNRVDGRARRKHERFQFKSTVSMKVGDRELKGEITTISVGGVQVNTDQWLEEGGVVTMSIRSPDGKDEIQVDGKVVWSEERKSYGVAFANAEDSTRAVISRWTKLMTKA